MGTGRRQRSAVNRSGSWPYPPERVREMLFTAQQNALGDEYEVPEHIPTARRFLKDVLGRVRVRPGRGPVEERVEIEAGRLAA